jgi:protein ImuA
VLAAIGGPVARQRLHAIHPSAPGQQPAAAGFAIALMLALQTGPSPILWVQTRQAAAESGHPYGLGLAGLGLDPARVVVVQVASAMEALAAAEMGLEEAGLAGVLVDLPARMPADMLRLGKRLALRAEARQTPCILLHAGPQAVAAPVASRWTVASSAVPRGLRVAVSPDLTTAFDLVLTKNRFGPLGRWSVVWRPRSPALSPIGLPVACVAPLASRACHAPAIPDFEFAPAAHHQPVVPESVDRSVGTPHGARPVWHQSTAA